MNNPPIFYDKINEYTSAENPSTLHVHNTAISRFYRKYLLQDVVSVIKPFFPDTFAENMVMFNIFLRGGVCVFETKEFGLVALPATLGGYTVYYTPAYCQVANPLIKGIQKLTIGKECGYIHLMPNYTGLFDIICYYADKLALIDESLHMNLANSKFSYLFETNNKAGAESLKKMFDQIQEGNLAVFYDKMLNAEDSAPMELFTQQLRQMFIAPDLIQAKNNIIDEFHTMVGIPNANTQKRERLISDEVNANNVSTFCKPELWLDTLNKSAEKANELFNTNISFEMRFTENGKSDNIDSRNLQL